MKAMVFRATKYKNTNNCIQNQLIRATVRYA